jgi:hypothetical protein
MSDNSAMPERYWIIHPNGGRQLIDPRQFDLDRLAEQAHRMGSRLVLEMEPAPPASKVERVSELVSGTPPHFEPPVSALSPLFQLRLEQIFECKEKYTIDINTRPTVHVLGGYYRKIALVRVYSHDRVLGRRPLEELYDTFLHEVAHHLEYTEPETFQAAKCGRVRGRMHSRLFWHILGDLKRRWVDHQRRSGTEPVAVLDCLDGKSMIGSG